MTEKAGKETEQNEEEKGTLKWGRQKARRHDTAAVRKAAVLNAGVLDPAVPEQRARRASSVDADSLGFTSLLQLADAGVQLEKRRKKPTGQKPATAKKTGAGKKTAAKKPAAKSGGDQNEKDSDSDSDAEDDHPNIKKRGRGPNKVQETDEEREAKRQRRVQANRESARQTIRRKHEQYDDLNGKAASLEQINAELRDEMNTLFETMRGLAAQNAQLREAVTNAAKKKGVPVPDIGDSAVALACAKEIAPVVPAAPSRATHTPLSSVPRIVPKQTTQTVRVATTTAAPVPPAPAAAPPPFVNGVAAALGGLARVPGAPTAATWPAAQNHAAIWGPFANVVNAMAAAARQTGQQGAPGDTSNANANATPSVPGAPVFSPAIMMPFFHPTMSMTAPNGFAWPPAAALGPVPGAAAAEPLKALVNAETPKTAPNAEEEGHTTPA